MQESSEQLKKYYMSVLGSTIESYRKSLGKSIYTISAEACVPRSTWRDIEFGVSKDTNLSTFCKIAEGLDIPPHKLLKELTDKLGKDFSFTDLN